MSDEFRSHPIKVDEAAASADPKLPAFLARPQGAPVYHGFPVVPESETDGWFFGAISEFVDPAGCTDGDGYVIAPDGSRAGLVWMLALATYARSDRQRKGGGAFIRSGFPVQSERSTTWSSTFARFYRSYRRFIRESLYMAHRRSNQSLEPTAGRCDLHT